MTARHLLIMLSIDGLGAELVDDPTLPLPALRSLIAGGARARRLAPIFPTVTWPCHTSIVTGVWPARHGVLGNLVFDRAAHAPVEHVGDRTTAPVLAETLWDRLHAQDQRVAAICWPKTRGVAAVADNIPEFYEQALFEQYASRPLWTELAQRRLPVDRYGPWSAAHRLGPMQDWLTLEAGRHVLGVRPPRLLLLHCLTLDSFQHDYGVDSPEARWALIQMDALVGRLLATLDELGLTETTTVMVFGDHGFVDVRTTHHLNQILREDGLLDVDARGAITRRLAWAAGNGGAAPTSTSSTAHRAGPSSGSASASPRSRASRCSGPSASRTSACPRPGPAPCRAISCSPATTGCSSPATRRRRRRRARRFTVRPTATSRRWRPWAPRSSWRGPVSARASPWARSRCSRCPHRRAAPRGVPARGRGRAAPRGARPSSAAALTGIAFPPLPPRLIPAYAERPRP